MSEDRVSVWNHPGNWKFERGTRALTLLIGATWLKSLKELGLMMAQDPQPVYLHGFKSLKKEAYHQLILQYAFLIYMFLSYFN